MATHSSIFAWRILWTEEPGGLRSIGLQSWAQLKRHSMHASAYLRLSIFLPAILIPACDSFSPAFHMMYSGKPLQSWKKLPKGPQKDPLPIGEGKVSAQLHDPPPASAVILVRKKMLQTSCCEHVWGRNKVCGSTEPCCPVGTWGQRKDIRGPDSVFI